MPVKMKRSNKPWISSSWKCNRIVNYLIVRVFYIIQVSLRIFNYLGIENSFGIPNINWWWWWWISKSNLLSLLVLNINFTMSVLFIVLWLPLIIITQNIVYDQTSQYTHPSKQAKANRISEVSGWTT